MLRHPGGVYNERLSTSCSLSPPAKIVMKLNLDQIRQNCQRARQLMARARNERFAVGAFNIDNQETLIAVCRAARAQAAPVLVEASQTEVEALGLQNIRDLVDNYRDQYRIEIFVNLDHSPSVEAAAAAIETGFEFIHIDLSQANKEASLAEIIAATKQVVGLAQKTGALVESEPHYFGGSSNRHDQSYDYDEIKKTFSDPAESADFVAQTGIDTFAAAIGNLHGSYPVPKQLDIELLQKIRQALPKEVNISLHGGSGTPGDYYRQAAAAGVSKINVNSDLRLAFRTTLERVLAENPGQYATVKLMPTVIAAVEAVVASKIADFGSAQKAQA